MGACQFFYLKAKQTKIQSKIFFLFFVYFIWFLDESIICGGSLNRHLCSLSTALQV